MASPASSRGFPAYNSSSEFTLINTELKKKSTTWNEKGRKRNYGVIKILVYAFYTFFISIGNEMAQQIPKVTCGDEPPCMRVPLEPFEFKSVDEEETIIKSITSLRDNSGQG